MQQKTKRRAAERKNVGGRPPFPPEKRKSDYINVRCTPQLRRRVSRVSKLYGMSTPEFVRIVLDEACAANEHTRE